MGHGVPLAHAADTDLMADLVYTRDNILHRGSVCRVSVYTKADWSDIVWTHQDTMLCESLEHTCQGVIGKAEFKHHYGHITQEWGLSQASAGYQPIAPVDLLNHWVRIDYTPQRVESADPTTLTDTRPGQVAYNTTVPELQRFDGDGGPGWVTASDLSTTYSWYGVITSQEDMYHGADSSSGDRVYRAMSLEYLLHKVQVMESRVEVDETSTSDPVATPRGIPFNGGRRGGKSSRNDIVGNRGHKTQYTVSPPLGVADRNVFQFARSLKFFDNSGDSDTDTHSAVLWTPAEIIDYLLYWYPPNDTDGPTWILAPSTQELDDLLRDNLQYQDFIADGRTLLEILNDILDRRRGFVWWLEVDAGSDEVWVRVDSYSSTDITLSSGGTVLPANSRQYFIDWSFQRDTDGTHRYITDSVKSYDQVVAMGAEMGSVFTTEIGIGAGDGMVEDWEGAEETAYDAAFSGDAGYASLDLSRKESINDEMRVSDDLRHVFTRFKLRSDWDETDVNGNVVFPDWTDYDDAPVTPATKTPGLWIQGRRLENFVLLKERHDYTSDPPVDNNPSGTVADYLPPIVVAEVETISGTATTYAHLDRPQGTDDELLFQTEGLSFACSISPHAEQPGLNIVPTTLPHVIGDVTNVYDGSAGEAVSRIERSQVDMSTMRATVYMTHDKRVQQSAGSGGTRHNQDSTLYIRLGERAHYDVLCPQTVLGISDDRTSLVLSPNSYVVLRDDRKLLQDIASVAAEWHAKERNAIDIRHNQVIGDYFVGSLLTSMLLNRFAAILVDELAAWVVDEDGAVVIGAEEEAIAINSVVTNVRHEFGNTPRTIVKTQFVELDYRSLARG